MAGPGCTSCGQSVVPARPNRGLDGSWSVRWPHGPLQRVDSYEAGVAFAAERPDLTFTIYPPADGPDALDE